MAARLGMLWDVKHALLEHITETWRELGAEVEWIRWNSIGYAIGDKTVWDSLMDCDAVYLDRLGEETRGYPTQLHLLRELAGAHTRVVNPPIPYWTAMDKALSAMRFQAASIPTPRTAIVSTMEAAEEFARQQRGGCIAKSILGTSAMEVAAFRSGEMPVSLVSSWLERDGIVLVQEWVEFSDRYIWRIDVVGGQIIVANRRFTFNPDSEFPLCNGNKGGEIEFLRPERVPDAVRELALQTMARFGLEVAGVDLLPDDDGRLWVIDVNSSPDITLDRYEFPRAIAAFVAKAASEA
jgi:glutathione synthase/RimK-type ligase-like ATP-grasp enzyme